MRLSLCLLLLLTNPVMALPHDVEACADNNILPPDFVIGGEGEPHRLRVCYNWGCSNTGELLLNQEDRGFLEQLFNDPACGAGSLGLELQMIRLAVQYLETRAGEQLPIGNDLGGNHRDRHLDGAADCVDNANNTHNYLRFLLELGYLKHWLSPPQLPIAQTCAFCPVPQHYTAIIRPRAQEGLFYVVDSWLLDNGSLPLVGPLEAWRKSWLLEGRQRLNPHVRLKDIQQFCQGDPSPYFIDHIQPALRDLPGLSADPAD
jgi:hypothetical protein